MPTEDIRPGMSREAAASVAREIMAALNGDRQPEVNPYRAVTVPPRPEGMTAEQATAYDAAVKTLRDTQKQLDANITGILQKRELTPDDCAELARAVRAWDQDGRPE